MNIIIPFEKKLDFKNTIKEICSISLEHEITQNESEVLGNFLISGTYKEHELSINLSEFDFIVPFSVELEKKIDTDSLEFSIDNFTYVVEGKEMLVKIDYILRAEELPEEERITLEEIEVPEFEEIVEKIDTEIEKTKEPEEKEREKEKIIENKIVQDEVLEINQTVATSLPNAEDDYITYHVHIVKKEETLEQIALNYHIEKEEILKINESAQIIEHEKILIPITNE